MVYLVDCVVSFHFDVTFIFLGIQNDGNFHNLCNFRCRTEILNFVEIVSFRALTQSPPRAYFALGSLAPDAEPTNLPFRLAPYSLAIVHPRYGRLRLPKPKNQSTSICLVSNCVDEGREYRTYRPMVSAVRVMCRILRGNHGSQKLHPEK